MLNNNVNSNKDDSLNEDNNNFAEDDRDTAEKAGYRNILAKTD
ncbi:23235_t:CDS:2 [Cetraspora pellucida]|uniref:23235_t:CDS:1 n=1 Tax=Cetraspora pellucida TaxID=1433469 RepID=A0A9N8ZLP5_9GLOM|nr:23235_t:CDS:2 [Cetraspora pellucida]